MTDWLSTPGFWHNPALVMVLGALLIPALRGRALQIWTLLLPVVALIELCLLPQGLHGSIELYGYMLNPFRLDGLSFIFSLIFLIAGFIASLYALHVEDRVQQLTAALYAGGGVGAVLAGDLITLFIWWEVMAIASVFLIWARNTERAYTVGMRYLIIQVLSGVVLLAGSVIYADKTGSIFFDKMSLHGPGEWLILLAFGIKCGFPLLHNWLQDAYPEATVTGTVILSVFTTKLAVYALARGFPGTELLIWIGCIMTAFPIFFAVIENDMRRVLAYSLNNQLGFMVAGIGIGTTLAINGAAAHAFCHILYKALLFMSMGAVLYRVGTIKASKLGGLYKSMPWTAGFCIIGSMSISAFPLFSGFISKSMILAAAGEEHLWLVFLVLLFASAGVLDHSGIKIPFFTFFAHDSGIRCEEAPTHMLLAMGITAFLCIAIGVYPAPLYAILPSAVDFVPYTTTHVLTQLQLLLFSALAFTVLYRRGLYPPEIPGINLDFDWFYRKLAPAMVRSSVSGLAGLRDQAVNGLWPNINKLGQKVLSPVKNGGAMETLWGAAPMVGLALTVLALMIALQN